MHFILTNAAKYDVEDATLGNELGQLGLPKGMEGGGRERERATRTRRERDKGMILRRRSMMSMTKWLIFTNRREGEKREERGDEESRGILY